MDAFERLVCQLFHANGWWTESSYKVELTKAEKVKIGRPSCPRWEIDVMAFKPAENRVLAIECKSFLDSRGVTFRELTGATSGSRYKLFTEQVTREVVLRRLKLQLAETGLCLSTSNVTLCMAAAKVSSGDHDQITSFFEQQGWMFYGPEWIKDQLHALTHQGYTNEIASVVAKLLLKGSPIKTAPTRPSLDQDKPLRVMVESNPKRPRSKAHYHFQCYYKEGSNTVGGALANGVRMIDIRHDVKKGFIEIG